MNYLLFVAVAAFFGMVWSFGVEPRWLKIRKIPIQLKTPLRQPLTILHISDSHFPLHLKTLRRFFKQLSSLEPDLLAFTGDIIENDEGVSGCAEAVSTLKSRLGKFAVLGNHDHYNYSTHDVLAFVFTLAGKLFFPKDTNNVGKLKEALAGAGCRVLCNESVDLDIDGQKVSLIGLDDPVTQKADPDKAFQNVNGGDGARILLTHSMDILRKMNGYPVDFALAGHTHGGQVSIPIFGALPLKTHSKLGRKYIVGLNQYQGAQTYTSRGIGMGKFFSFRFLCRPEAVLFEIS